MVIEGRMVQRDVFRPMVVIKIFRNTGLIGYWQVFSLKIALKYVTNTVSSLPLGALYRATGLL